MPTLINTVEAGIAALNGAPGASYTAFTETINDAAADSFDGYFVQEGIAAPGTDTCNWNGSGLPAAPVISGGTWTVDGAALTGDGKDGSAPPPTHNKWGYDFVGFSPAAVKVARQAPAHGVKLPCTATIYQRMQIQSCSDGSYYVYASSNVLSITVAATSLTNTRRGVGALFNY